MIQPFVTPLAVAIEQEVRAGHPAAARELEGRYTRFMQDLWRYGVSHLDFSILNVGIIGSGEAERLAIFDPHMGVIEVAGGTREVQDPLAACPTDQRSLEDLLRAARDGSRWALWRAEQNATRLARRSARAVPPKPRRSCATSTSPPAASSRATGTSASVASTGRGSNEAPTASTPSCMPSSGRSSRHPLGRLLHSILEPPASDAIYDRALPVLGVHDERRSRSFGPD